MALKHLLVACALVSVSLAYNGNYNCASGRDAVVHLFEWKYSDIERECSYLASQGYCAVQISPATEHAVITNPYRPWWERYQPVSYKLDSRGGTQAQLAQMISTCNGLGVRVYADVVINHMTGGGSGTGTGGSSWNGGGGSSSDYGGQSYPGVPYGTNDFHAAGSGSRQCPTSSMNIEDYNNANQVRNCRLSGLRDLAMETSYVRQKVIDLLNSLLALGVAGFRVDACKHMWPEDLQYIFDRLNNLDTRWFPANTPPYVYQEVIDMGTGEPIKASDYTFLGRVKEFKYGSKLSEVVLKLNGQRLAYLENFGEAWGFLNALDAFAFVDNHDNQRGSGAGGTIVTYKQPREYKIAVAYMLAWSYGHVRVMSSYDFSSHDQGPPANPDGSIQDVVCQYDGGPWICEHRWRQIANMVRFHNAALGQPVSNWWDNGYQAIAFSRGNKAWIGINNENFAVTGTYNTGMPAGDYCNVILCSGNRPPCSGESGCGAVTVSSSGQVTVTIQNNDNPIVAIHV